MRKLNKLSFLTILSINPTETSDCQIVTNFIIWRLQARWPNVAGEFYRLFKFKQSYVVILLLNFILVMNFDGLK